VELGFMKAQRIVRRIAGKPGPDAGSTEKGD